MHIIKLAKARLFTAGLVSGIISLLSPFALIVFNYDSSELTFFHRTINSFSRLVPDSLGATLLLITAVATPILFVRSYLKEEYRQQQNQKDSKTLTIVAVLLSMIWLIIIASILVGALKLVTAGIDTY